MDLLCSWITDGVAKIIKLVDWLLDGVFVEVETAQGVYNTGDTPHHKLNDRNDRQTDRQTTAAVAGRMIE